MKWASSAMIAKLLDVPPNLEGKFEVNIKFAHKLKEQQLLKELEQFQMFSAQVETFKSKRRKREQKARTKNEEPFLG